MAPKKKRVTDTHVSSAQSPRSILTDGALADLHFLDPIRTRNRVVSCFEELFARVERLERLHHEQGHG